MPNRRRIVNAGDPQRSYVDLNVSEPVVFLSIVSKGRKKKQREVKTNLSRKLGGVSKDGDLSNRVIKLEVSAKTKHASKVEITLYNEDLALSDSLITTKGTLIKIRYGYTGYLSRKRTFRIRKVKGTRARVKASGQITVIAYSQEADLGNKSHSRTFKSITVNELVRRVAKPHGISGEDLVLDPKQTARLKVAYQVNQTDQSFLTGLAQKLGWVFSLEDGVLTFAPHDFVSSNCKPIATWNYFTDNKGWVKRFEPEGNELSEVGSVTVKSQDPITGKPVKATATARTRKGRSLGKYVHVKPSQEGGTALGRTGRKIHRDTGLKKPGVLPSNQTVNRPGANVSSAKKEAQRRLDNKHSNLFKARAMNIGDPLIWKDQIVRFGNVGKDYSGNWKVAEVRHIIDSNGYDMELLLRKNATDSLGRGRKPDIDQTTKTQFASRRRDTVIQRRKRNTNASRTGTVKRTRFSRK